jgi:hypothetical protein
MTRLHPTKLIEMLAQDRYYQRSNIVFRDYTPDVVVYTLKHHWGWLEAQRHVDEVCLCMWIDLNAALDSLDEPERTVVRLYAEGWRAESLVQVTGQEGAGKMINNAAVKMANWLRGKEIG